MDTARVISLDLDDTLWPVGPVIAAAEAELLTWLRRRHPRAVDGHDAESMQALRGEVARRHPERSHDMTFLRQRALNEQFAAAGYVERKEGGMAAADEALEIFLLGRNRISLYADVRPALTRLRERCRLFALSNGNADLKRCGIDDLFDGHVTAAAAGAAKPDGRIFSHLLRVAGVEAGEVLHVGDDPLADVVGATQAGIRAVWLNREAKQWPPQFATPLRTITTLTELV